jgi:hypothetical protein
MKNERVLVHIISWDKLLSANLLRVIQQAKHGHFNFGGNTVCLARLMPGVNALLGRI